MAAERPIDKAIRQLALFDSIHDFWSQRGKRAAGDDDEDADDISADKLDRVRALLTNVIQTYTGSQRTEIGDILGEQTNNIIRTPSGIEGKTLAYLKTLTPPFSNPIGTITISEILSNWKFVDKGSDWPRYARDVSLLPNRIEIVGQGRSIKALSDTERGHLGFFILAYLNTSPDPSSQPGITDVMMSFDMSPRDIGKIFSRFNKVFHSICPQEIADSAPTSWSALLGRIRYFSVDGQPSPRPNATKVVTSNAFTRSRYIIRFEEDARGFSNTNKFGFQIAIYTNTNPPALIGRIPFGKGNEQGASVNYLADLLTLDDPRTAVPKISTIAKLTGLPIALLRDPAFLFDMKRTGDQEQINSDVPSIKVTGDQDAFAYTEAIKKRGIYHSTVGIRLTRGSDAIDPVQAQRQAQLFALSELVEQIKTLRSLQAQYASAQSDLAQMAAHINAGMTGGYVFTQPIKFPDAQGQPSPRPTLTRELIQQNYTKVANTVATYLLRLRMKDILQFIQGVLKDISNVDFSSVTDADVTLIEQGIAYLRGTNPSAPDSSAIESSVSKMQTLLANNASLRSVSNTITSTGSASPIKIRLFDDSGKLLPGVVCPFFKFASGPFMHAETGLAPSIARLLLNINARRPDAVKAAINKSLETYLNARDAIKEAFFDAALLGKVEEATDVSSGLTPAQIIGAPGAAGVGKQGIVDALIGVYRLATDPAPSGHGFPVPVAVGGADSTPTQTGGTANGRIYQFRDIHDLFVEICYDAEAVGSTYDLVAMQNAIYLPVHIADVQMKLSALKSEFDQLNQRAAQMMASGFDTRYAQSQLAPIQARLAQIQSQSQPLAADLQYRQGVLASAQPEREFYPIIRAALDRIESKWVEGIAEIRAYADEYDPGHVFEESPETDLVSMILSYRTEQLPDGRLTNTVGATFPLENASVYPSMATSRATARVTSQFNDIGGWLLTKIGVEPFILRALSKFATQFTIDPRVYESPGTDQRTWEWSGVALGWMAKFNEPMQGGSLQTRRDLYSNAGTRETSASGGRRGLYEGLRERPWTRTTARVRQHARHSRTRRQRQHVDRV